MQARFWDELLVRERLQSLKVTVTEVMVITVHQHGAMLVRHDMYNPAIYARYSRLTYCLPMLCIEVLL